MIDGQNNAGTRRTWEKRGVLVEAVTRQAWAHSHAALPAVQVTDDRSGDLYYSPRDERGRAYIARARLSVGPRGELVVSEHDPEPVLTPGALGAFDDSGVTMSCVVESDDATHLYYTGWALGVSVPFYFYGGVAIRRHGEQLFERVSEAPILERNAVDPYLTASPWVVYDKGTWRMWYVSCTRWEAIGEEARHYYHLRYAESTDGIQWDREGVVVIDFAGENEYAISRPCVVGGEHGYRMWFAARGDSYRLGYAESPDGVDWHRHDEREELLPSETGWDSEMIAYPAIVTLAGREYLLYNGNGYGRSGIGYATFTAAV